MASLPQHTSERAIQIEEGGRSDPGDRSLKRSIVPVNGRTVIRATAIGLIRAKLSMACRCVSAAAQGMPLHLRT